ncbi:hypothetical protein AAVH_37878, partial [Aphelenchoides avenae]
VFMESFCGSYISGDWIQTKGNKTVQVLRSVKDGMGLLTNLSSEAGEREPCAMEPDTAWSEKINSYAKRIIDAKMEYLKPQSWEDRQELHGAVAKDIVRRLKQYE